MAKTFHFEIQKKPTSKGTYPIYVRITEGRKHRRVKTSIELNRLSDWNPKPKQGGNYVRQSEPHYEKWNQALDDELQAIKDASRENQGISLDSLAKTIKKGGNPESFLEFAKAKVEEARVSQSIGTHRHYLTTIQQLEGFLKSEGKSDLLFSELDLAFLKGFESYLGSVENQREKGRKLDTITKANYLKKLRKLVNEAEDEEKIEVGKNPFSKFSIKSSGESKKEKLEQDELDRIIALDLEDGSVEWHTRNAFLFSFYCAGIRAGDLLQLRWSNVEGGRLNYTMGKTDKVRNFELVADAEAILAKYRTANVKESDYIFPFLDSNAKWAIESYKDYNTMAEDLKKALFNQVSSKNVILNRSLQKIALKAKVKKHLTMHCSRHSFANMAMRDNLPPSVIKMLLAHSSLKTTEGYMGNFSNDEADKALTKMFSKKNTKGSQGANNDLISALNNADKETLVTAFAELLNRLNQ